MLYKKSGKIKTILNLLTMPLIWAPFAPTIFVDILFYIYEQICFPIYGIKKTKRSDYIQVLDRNKLKYLKWYEKLGCMYCGYMNGVFRYMKEISGRTEKYWCGIMHGQKAGFIPQDHQFKQGFSRFNDEEDFNSKYL